VRKRILDSNKLINHWHAAWTKAKNSRRQLTTADVKQWAQDLIATAQNNAILTPIYLEFIAGTRSSNELELARAFLQEFERIDKGEIRSQDWHEAERYASQVPRDGRPRDLVDCLIKAVAKRLRMDIDTADKRFAH
jgi:predicted nucleic acid-binding protein